MSQDALLEEIQKLKEENEKLKQSEATLQKMNSLKDRLFSIISHDIKSPLNTLSSLLNIMVKYAHTFSPDELKSYSIDIQNSLDGVKFLLANLMQWSRAQMDELDYSPREIDLTGIIKQNIDLYRLKAKSKNIRLEAEIGEIEAVFADQDMLSFIVRNLLSNALKFTEEKGKIIIKVEHVGGMAKVSVIDTGIGVPPEFKDNLFKKDVLTSTFGTAREKGTGLGLIITHEFVKQHGGEVSVESEEGKGSIFSFTIPLSKES